MAFTKPQQKFQWNHENPSSETLIRTLITIYRKTFATNCTQVWLDKIPESISWYESCEILGIKASKFQP